MKFLYVSSLVLLSYCCVVTSGSEAEARLQSSLLKNYDQTVIPSKNSSKAVQVQIDVALRSIQSLDEKNEKLVIAAWIRLYWKNEFFTWDPRNHSGVDELHFDRVQVWTPDVVLYNSADQSDEGLLFDKMRTGVIVKPDGSSQWLCPVLLHSECGVELFQFPFDNQTCPLVFGLWSVPFSDIPRVDLSMAKPTGDLSAYVKNGVFELDGMPARETVVYFPCCPGVPFIRVQYDIIITRRTIFYLVDFFFPTLLLIVLLFMSFALPPECGERISLSISLLLAFVLHLLHVSDHIPRTSDAVPMVSKLLTASISLSAVTLLSSAISIKWSFYKNDGKPLPWFIRVVLNHYVSMVVFPKWPYSSQNSSSSKHTITEASSIGRSSFQNRKQNSMSFDDKQHVHSEETDLASITLRHRASGNESASGDSSRIPSNDVAMSRSNFLGFVREAMQVLAGKIEKQESDDAYSGEWRQAIRVLDRALFLISFFCIFVISIHFFFFTSSLYVK